MFQWGRRGLEEEEEEEEEEEYVFMTWCLVKHRDNFTARKYQTSRTDALGLALAWKSRQLVFHQSRVLDRLGQCFSTSGPRPGTGPWDQ
jgi:hypothetical protein